MSNPLTDAREYVTEAVKAVIDNALVFSQQPSTVSSPCVVVGFNNPWVTQKTLSRVQVSLTVEVLVPLQMGDRAMARTEELAWAIMSIPGMSTASSPQYQKVGQADVYRSTCTISVLSDEGSSDDEEGDEGP